MTDWIFGNELQERRCLEVVAALEQGVLMCQVRMFFQVQVQAFRVAGIEEIYCTSKGGVFYTFVMGQV